MIKEWENEPNRLEWEYKGFKCLISRHESSGHLCGYVAIPEGHEHYGKDYMEINVDVHGGLTFGEYGHSEEHKEHQGYKAETDEQGRKLFWIGFDCAHYMDYCPYQEEFYKKHGIKSFSDGREHYRNIKYVQSETEGIVDQLL